MESEENRIFDEWKAAWRARPNYRGQEFLPDGAMPDFAQQTFRLLFVAKEGNDPEGSWTHKGGDLRFAWDWGYSQVTTWRRLATWAALILENRSVEDSERLSEETTRAILRKIAFINLKKAPGGASSTYKEIHDTAIADQDFIRRQLALYKPTVTICCGQWIFPLLEQIYGMQNQRAKLAVADDDGDEFYSLNVPAIGRVIDFWHPQARTSASKTIRKLAGVLTCLRSDTVGQQRAALIAP